MRVGIYVMDGVFDSGLAVVSDILRTADDLIAVEGSSLRPWSVTLLGASTQARTGSGLLAATTPADEVLDQVDLRLVPAPRAPRPSCWPRRACWTA